MTPQREQTKFDKIVSLIILVAKDDEKSSAARLHDWYSRPEVFNISRPFNEDSINPASCAIDLIEYYFNAGERPAVLNSLRELWRSNAPWNSPND